MLTKTRTHGYKNPRRAHKNKEKRSTSVLTRLVLLRLSYEKSHWLFCWSRLRLIKKKGNHNRAYTRRRAPLYYSRPTRLQFTQSLAFQDPQSRFLFVFLPVCLFIYFYLCFPRPIRQKATHGQFKKRKPAQTAGR